MSGNADPGTMPELVAAVVGDHPDRVAVDFGERTLTYRELWELSGQVMAHLRRHVGDRASVGVCAERSPLAFAGYLAVLRLGAAVVPLQPTNPVARTLLLAKAARVEHVLADDGASSDLLSSLAAASVGVSRRQDIRAEGPRADRSTSPAADPDDIAYILFTSGSTGAPKGVPIRHRNAVSYLRHNIDWYEVEPGCRLSHTFSLTFDPSVFDLFAAWGAGATTVVPQGNELVVPARYVTRRGVTHWFSVPSAVTAASTLRGLRANAMSNLRWSMFIGDQLTWEQAQAWRTAAPDSVLENVYGPTELTVACAAAQGISTHWLGHTTLTWGRTPLRLRHRPRRAHQRDRTSNHHLHQKPASKKSPPHSPP